MKKGQITLTGSGPLQLEEDVDCPLPEPTDEQVGIVRQVGAAVKAYLSAAEALLVGKYAHLQDWAPPHLRAPGNVLVACCADGVVIRYEPKATEKHYFIGWFPGKLPEVASLLSQKVVRCRSSGDDPSESPEAGI